MQDLDQDIQLLTKFSQSKICWRKPGNTL